MADFGFFLGWGSPRTGKEAAAAKVFAEGSTYWAACKAAGEIESFEQVILDLHGGDLIGFVLVRGDPEKLGRLRRTPEFRRHVLRAGNVLDGVGVVDAYIDAGVMQFMSAWGAAIADLS